MSDPRSMQLGAHYLGGDKTAFCIWAPHVSELAVRIVGSHSRSAFLEKAGQGYFVGTVADLSPGSQYCFELAGMSRPDPASRLQPQGVHGPSQIIDPHFNWSDTGWRGRPLEEYVIYELHVGTFTTEGTFEAITRRLDELKELGITALELMPLAQFPGTRNWGYDGVFPFAVQNNYGGPVGLKRLINSCHERGLAVILDVVYNHLGPEGNCFADYGPYFTDRYRTPWGAAINYDGTASDEVRRYFIENALYWLRDCHLDALRLDALHAIHDMSAIPFLEDLSRVVDDEAEASGRRLYLFAESDLNDTRLIRRREEGGLGLHAHWNEDFHHSLHARLTGEQTGYYADFGSLEDLATALSEGFVYGGKYSRYRQRRQGRNSRDVPARRFVVFSQNHDQVGNRVKSDRLSTQLSLDEQKLAAAFVMLSPYLPLLFMGEEYGETAPFYYFVNHSDPKLNAAVRSGRLREMADFGWAGTPPDPADPKTFEACRLEYSLRKSGRHSLIYSFYKELLRLRHETPALAYLSKQSIEVSADEETQVITVRRYHQKSDVWMVFHFGDREMTWKRPPGYSTTLLDSTEPRWSLQSTDEWQGNTGSTRMLLPKSVLVLCKEAAKP